MTKRPSCDGAAATLLRQRATYWLYEQQRETCKQHKHTAEIVWQQRIGNVGDLNRRSEGGIIRKARFGCGGGRVSGQRLLKPFQVHNNHRVESLTLNFINGGADGTDEGQADVGNKQIRDSICIQARLLWLAPETIGNYHFLRLYLGEQQAPEPLRQQQQEFQAAQRDDPFEANQYLITLSLYGVSPNDPQLPATGSVISFSPTEFSIYRNCCQVNAKLSAIKTINDP
ncbi:uncharacterized protein PITG_08864 [Phytophthora infestans T30-4]|uniref:Uncharacterized protein n=1 Tax=Phytophthora infestans (strain T30-4) TaxID=403677 RepID=D0NDD0_PHYIT|nr:uncharacterized protein PITG_08864 [Phytophthora infestans T30-4]EEY56087.1 conserved hypothetical protein [Phytophthora infestans T30-4]|eukprot:XP_002902917.1 conserved hypothetical protein [Phytophthora infestans T30-4]